MLIPASTYHRSNSVAYRDPDIRTSLLNDWP
jgi:hypothetical protein